MCRWIPKFGAGNECSMHVSVGFRFCSTCVEDRSKGGHAGRRGTVHEGYHFIPSSIGMNFNLHTYIYKLNCLARNIWYIFIHTL